MKGVVKNQKGYIALIAVIIVVMVTLAIGLSLNLLSISEMKSGLLKQQSWQSFTLADSCLDEALLRLRRDANFSGANLNIGRGSCTITVVRQGFFGRVITVESNVDNIIRNLRAEVRIFLGRIVFNDWRELD